MLYRGGILAARAPAVFGVWLRDAGLPHHVLVHAILGVQELRPHGGPFLTETWDILRKWRLAGPPVLMPPLPRALLKAMVSICLTWDWPHMAALLLAAFTMRLRPVELL